LNEIDDALSEIFRNIFRVIFELAVLSFNCLGQHFVLLYLSLFTKLI